MMDIVDDRPRARVFISCGQQRETDEERIARDIADELRYLGFEPYIAVAEQTLRGVQDNVFERLSNSEYLLFIDFKREKLENTAYHRGSLFSHQELALATYLGIEVLAFREDGVIPEDGLLQFLQANCIPFDNRDRLLKAVLTGVRERGWNPRWRNGLSFERHSGDYEEWGSIRFFHVRVRNEHRNRIARDCTVYVTRIRNLSKQTEWTPNLHEFKWKGVRTPSVAIPPGLNRSFDAFNINRNDPTRAWLGINDFVVDRKETYNELVLEGPGPFEIRYELFSSNLPRSEATFRLSIGHRVEDVEFSMVSP